MAVLLAALAVGVGVACRPAPPVDLGTEITTPELSGGNPDAGAAPEEIDDSGAPFMTLDPAFDAFVKAGWDRGEVSPYCHSSFQACGGLLAGTWVVEDNCNPEIRALDVLQGWGQARLKLDKAACWNAIQLMRWNWMGELRFENGLAIDNRERTQRVDMQLTAQCLTATFGFEPADSVSPQLCNDLQDESTTCALASGVCLCSNQSMSKGAASGPYGVLGLSVAIGDNPSTRYEYCVNGDHLLWREKDGAQRQVVMKRSEGPTPGTTDPIEIPR